MPAWWTIGNILSIYRNSMSIFYVGRTTETVSKLTEDGAMCGIMRDSALCWDSSVNSFFRERKATPKIMLLTRTWSNQNGNLGICQSLTSFSLDVRSRACLHQNSSSKKKNITFEMHINSRFKFNVYEVFILYCQTSNYYSI